MSRLPNKLGQVRKGDQFSFLLEPRHGCYEATSEPNDYEILADFVLPNGKRTIGCTVDLNDLNEPVIILNRDPDKENVVTDDTSANEAKLELAADFELRAKFNYTNEEGETRDRRLVVNDFDGEHVYGESYDENGAPEGYRNFRLDRINGPVTIR